MRNVSSSSGWRMTLALSPSVVSMKRAATSGAQAAKTDVWENFMAA
jgi:hypothetical protein